MKVKDLAEKLKKYDSKENISIAGIQEIVNGMFSIGKVRFEKGDTMLVSYSVARTTPDALRKVKERLPKQFLGIRIVFIPDIFKISRLRFTDVDGKLKK